VVTAGCIHLIYKRLARHSLAIAIFLAVMTLDLWTFSNALIKTTDLSLDQKKMALLSDLNSDFEIHRIAVMNDSRVPNDGLVYRYQDIQGYDPLILKRYLSYINRSQNTLRCSEAVNVGHVKDLDNRLIRMLNVKYAISNKTALLQALNPLPRAYIVHKAITVPLEKVLDFMMADSFNPLEAVVFEDLQQQEAFSWSPSATHGIEKNGSPEWSMTDGTEYCKVKAYKNEEIALSATMNHDGYLVLSEINYPGWVAYVNGRKKPLLTGNYIFRVLPLSKGNHDIVIRFESRSFRVGIIISAVTLCCCALLLASALVRNRRR
jgi:uncharacterized membrane protein YfhO